MTPLYLLDTNTVSYLIKRHPQVTQRLLAVPMHSVCISAITAGELAFGLAKRPEALALKATVDEFLRRVQVLPWDDAVAKTYGTLRAQLQSQGSSLAALDMQIAAHAVHMNAKLISSDKAFLKIALLQTEDWSLPASDLTQ
jgi:tRNA(fMet)-specific endonuclease VapC